MSMIQFHLGASLVALGAIIAVMALPKGRDAHRLLGRVAAAGLMAAAISSFWITSRGHWSWIHLLSLTTAINLPFAVLAARRGRIAAHKRAMLANAGGLVVAGLFAVFAPGRYLHAVLFG
ncbi:MAG: hypothetical protein K2X11_10605 [Acetobacteraceae bacterium]|nr:hypothetical protein [Acetobacteraceae bacterium]